MNNRPETIMLIDGNSLAYRAFYALPDLKTSQGIPTSAVYGFLTMFFKVKREYEPDYLVVAFDKDKRNLRHDMYEDYKGTRKATPPELRQQFPLLRQVLAALKVPTLEMEGYEADDIIGAVSCQANQRGIQCLIVTGDQDALQLVSSLTRVVLNRKGISEIELYDQAAVLEKWEVSPAQLVDVKALMGDASDNIPGVPSVGKKTAIKLIKQFGGLEGVYEALEQVAGEKLRQALRDNREQAFLSRELARIMCTIEVPLDWEACRVSEPDYDRLLELYRDLEFGSLIKELNDSRPPAAVVSPALTMLEPEEFMNHLDLDQPLAVWVQASGAHPMWARIEALYLAQAGRGCRIEYREENRPLIKLILEGEDYGKVLHNAKFLEVAARRDGIKLRGVREDTLLLSYCLNPSFSGESLAEHIIHYLGAPADEKKDPISVISQLEALAANLHQQSEGEVAAIYREVELPLSSILAEMEFTGIRVDVDRLRSLSVEMEDSLGQLTDAIYNYAGGSFNLNSPRQLGTVLFDTLKLPAKKKTKTGYSTSAEVLEDLYEAHPIVPLILEYRTLSKLKTTYIDALPLNVHPETGRVHTIFKQAVTATGRLSSVEPNLQNIPVRNEQGARIRQAFVAEEGKVLLSADYSQIDLRVLAHMSRDEQLIRAFTSGEDIHTSTAASIFHVAEAEVTSTLRRRAKAVNFGIVYGISDFGLARGTGVSRQEARLYIEKYLDTYPGVRQYMKDVVETGRNQGYVTTILGRRRYLPDLLASNYQVRSLAERMALNTPIQGSSADIIKLAMIEIDRRLKQEDLPARMLLQVHDELIFEVPEEQAGRLAALVRECMESALVLAVPLEVSVEVGPNWQDMKEWK